MATGFEQSLPVTSRRCQGEDRQAQSPGAKQPLHGAERAKAASKSVDAHLRYLERDGVDRDGQRGKAYSALENEADGKAFVERGRDDRHQLRFIVAPEGSNEMADLRSFARDLMRQVEKDLDTRLDWIAIDHYNTGHPHTHIIVRGVLEEGGVLNIAGDYIAHGIRYRASELVTLELGHQSRAASCKQPRLSPLDRLEVGCPVGMEGHGLGRVTQRDVLRADNRVAGVEASTVPFEWPAFAESSITVGIEPLTHQRVTGSIPAVPTTQSYRTGYFPVGLK